ncbi:carnitine 3-dehydrogenase [Lichenihabitans sp. Uapishka_5]|uniref:carnitine 3-dehydrogenase n=1 Tax=Lichenihabitans sp. Uapishka_5 TaxID=3037302 RepID=UPI0029E81DCA|nr:carnitine 3-dehydrogenase [Lichenihabitans sp. Uapishka_5]MDX7951954.1 carnitine 3-dehydrogenase [Lichenihabitans sp. Uapishka_5]
MSAIRTIGLVGGGVIGAGWAARFLVNGYDVAVYDPDPELARKLDAVLDNARRAQAKLFSGLTLPEGRLSLAATLAEAVGEADFVVESLPEIEGLKVRVLAEVDAATRPEVVIATSTSGLLPTRLQAGMVHPERLVVGHPFNPVYLLPLVEVCGGSRTSEAAKAEATALYERIGMRPLQVRKEIDGFIADRLLEALWREALWLVNDGVATTEEIDDAVRFGAGLRWSFMGTFLVYRLAGGEAGMRHFLAQFGPALKLPWTRLEAPELTGALIDRVSADSDAQAAGVSIRTLERKRDDCLIAVLGGLRSEDYGAGAVLKRYEAQLVERLGVAVPEPVAGGPLALWSGTVSAEWIDYNGHMTESRYLQCCAEATDALLRRLGLDAGYLAGGHSFFTAETHLMHRGQAKLGDRLSVETQVLGGNAKRLHVFHRLLKDGDLVASAEQMLLHVDTKLDKVVAATGAMAGAVADLVALHADLPRPEAAGRAVGLKRAG